jgi:hypothetical protein
MSDTLVLYNLRFRVWRLGFDYPWKLHMVEQDSLHKHDANDCNVDRSASIHRTLCDAICWPSKYHDYQLVSQIISYLQVKQPNFDCRTSSRVCLGFDLGTTDMIDHHLNRLQNVIIGLVCSHSSLQNQVRSYEGNLTWSQRKIKFRTPARSLGHCVGSSESRVLAASVFHASAVRWY